MTFNSFIQKLKAKLPQRESLVMTNSFIITIRYDNDCTIISFKEKPPERNSRLLGDIDMVYSGNEISVMCGKYKYYANQEESVLNANNSHISHAFRELIKYIQQK